jgi:hypothetical protein
LAVEALEDRALLSTLWTVDRPGDNGDGSGQSGDLRYCITQADQTTGDNTIKFSVTGTIGLKSALPDLNNTTGLMDIEGPGASNLTVSGNNQVRVFQVDSGAYVDLVGLTITAGSADSGAGIYNAGTLSISGSAIDKNSASSPAVSDSSYGGGIYNTGVLTVINSTISNNTTATYSLVGVPTAGDAYGGGIYSTGTVDLSQCTLSGNVAMGQHGYLSVPGGNAFGGAVYTTGELTLDNCTVSNNSAEGGSGQTPPGYLAPGSAGGNAWGGGLYAGGTIHISGSSIEGNSAIGGNGAAPAPAGPGTPAAATPTEEGSTEARGGSLRP